jgi:phosphatidylinositol phospholipase C delta
MQAKEPNCRTSYLVDKVELNITELIKYITSPCGYTLKIATAQDLPWPLSSHLVSSSHNTYLTGYQLLSDFSVETYKDVLLRGCRYIGIDIWDGVE